MLGEQPSVGVEQRKEKPDSTQETDVVIAALPFPSLQLTASLVAYRSLIPSQVEAVQQVMIREQQSLDPLMTKLRTAREKLLAIGGEHIREKEVPLADIEASLLARLIVGKARALSKFTDISAPSSKRR